MKIVTSVFLLSAILFGLAALTSPKAHASDSLECEFDCYTANFVCTSNCMQLPFGGSAFNVCLDDCDRAQEQCIAACNQ